MKVLQKKILQKTENIVALLQKPAYSAQAKSKSWSPQKNPNGGQNAVHGDHVDHSGQHGGNGDHGGQHGGQNGGNGDHGGQHSDHLAIELFEQHIQSAQPNESQQKNKLVRFVVE